MSHAPLEIRPCSPYGTGPFPIAYPHRVTAAGDTPEALAHWLEESRPALTHALHTSGAVLLEGTQIASAEAFAAFSSAVFPEAARYVGGDSPRTSVGSRVYTTTEYPAEFNIPLHNEMSYAGKWPAQLLFCCIVPPEAGGETPIADSRRIASTLSPELVDEFDRRGVLYVRNLHGGFGFGRSWQQTFETTDRRDVERYCEETSSSFEWLSDDSLRLMQRRPALAAHPLTGERVWFNQVDQFHPTSESAEVYDELVEIYGDDPMHFPKYAAFGDGDPIPAEMLDEIRRVYRELAVSVPWRAGDVLWIDNMLSAHGRNAFRGPRRILVSMQ